MKFAKILRTPLLQNNSGQLYITYNRVCTKYIVQKHVTVTISKTNESQLHLFCKKRQVYKQLALGWQIAKQLSGLNPLSISNNKNYRLKESRGFPL